MSNVLNMPDPSLRSYANAAANSYGIPTDYFSRFISTESGWNPNAQGSHGELGLTQIIPSQHPGINDPLNPYDSIDYAAATIRSYFDTFGSWDAAFAAWNAGPARAQNPPSSTMNYVDKILGSGPIGPTRDPQTVQARENVVAFAPAPDYFRVFVYGIALGLLVIGIFGSLKNQHIPALQKGTQT